MSTAKRCASAFRRSKPTNLRFSYALGLVDPERTFRVWWFALAHSAGRSASISMGHPCRGWTVEKSKTGAAADPDSDLDNDWPSDEWPRPLPA